MKEQHYISISSLDKGDIDDLFNAICDAIGVPVHAAKRDILQVKGPDSQVAKASINIKDLSRLIQSRGLKCELKVFYVKEAELPKVEADTDTELKDDIKPVDDVHPTPSAHETIKDELKKEEKAIPDFEP